MRSATQPALAAASPAAALSLLLLALTFTTGLMDALSILALGRVFTALMTGNVVFVGLSLAGEREFSASLCSWALAAFAGGATMGGRMAHAHALRASRRWLLEAAFAETLLLAVAAAAALLLSPTARHATGSALWAIVALTAAAMGVRSATVLRIADPDLKTTVLTLTITALAADSRLGHGHGERWQRRVASVLMLALGALAGALSLHEFGLAASLALVAVLVLASTVSFARHPSSALALPQKSR